MVSNHYNHYQIAKEELAFYGYENASLQNILAVLIGRSADPAVTGELAAMGLRKISALSKKELKSFKGIGEESASRILAALGLSIMFQQETTSRNMSISGPDDAAKAFSYLRYEEQEKFDVLFLNTKNMVLGKKNIFKGTLDHAVVHPREIFKEAYRMSAASIICAHNHPSGDCTPSDADREVFIRLKTVGGLMGVEVLDFLVIGDRHYHSIKYRRGGILS